MATATSLLTLDPAWTPLTGCFEDLLGILTTQSESFIAAGGPWELTGCAPPGYTQAATYRAASCPTGYTWACHQTDYVAADQVYEAIAACCPTAMNFQCSDVGPSSVPQWCVSSVNETITTLIPTITLDGERSTGLGTLTLTLTPGDTVRGWEVLYVTPTTTQTPTPIRRYNVETSYIATSSPSTQPSTSADGLSDYLKQRIVIGAVLVFFCCVVVPIAAFFRRRRILARLKTNANGGLSPQEEQGAAANAFFASLRNARATRSGERAQMELPTYSRNPVQQDNEPAPPPTYAEATLAQPRNIHIG